MVHWHNSAKTLKILLATVKTAAQMEVHQSSLREAMGKQSETCWSHNRYIFLIKCGPKTPNMALLFDFENLGSETWTFFIFIQFGLCKINNKIFWIGAALHFSVYKPAGIVKGLVGQKFEGNRKTI